MAGVRVGRGNVSPASLQTSPAVELIARKNQYSGYLGVGATGNVTLPSPGFFTSFGHTILTDKGDTPNLVIRRGGPNNRFAGPVGSDADPTQNLASLPLGNQIGLVSGNPRAEPICHANGTQSLAALMTGTALNVHDLPVPAVQPPAAGAGQFPGAGNIAVVSTDGNTYMLSYSSLTGGSNTGTGADGTLAGIQQVQGHDAPANVTAAVVTNGSTIVTGILPQQRQGAVFGVTGAGIPAGPPITTITFTSVNTGTLSVAATATGLNVPLALGGSVTDGRTISLVENDLGNPQGQWASKPVQWAPYTSEDVTNSNGTVKAGGGVRVLTTPTGGTALTQAADFRNDGRLDFVAGGFSVYASVPLPVAGLAANTDYTVLYDLQEGTANANYNASTGAFTATFTGWHEFIVQTQLTGSLVSGVAVQHTILLNGSVAKRVTLSSGGVSVPGNEGWPWVVMVLMNAGDTAAHRIRHTAGSNKQVSANPADSFFQGRFVGRQVAIPA